MDVGCGSNTRFEILALWGLLYFASKRHVPDLQVMDNSRVIVNWAPGKHIIQTVKLEHRMRLVKRLFCSFNTIDFNHINKEFNSMDDILSTILSKPAIGLGMA